ncbi:hypothetical protein ACLRDI_30495 [Pseudomonas piscis]|uniref:hypothetical protein n=1 Tax=Pseudomonas piscis TaxID=2614538 RepID=UPI0039A5E9A4
MSNELDSKAILPGMTVIDETYMEQFTNDQLFYKAWIGTDLVQELIFDEEGLQECLQDAKFEAAYAAIALRVLVRRLIGMDPDVLRKAVDQRFLVKWVLELTTEQMPAWETLQ